MLRWRSVMRPPSTASGRGALKPGRIDRVDTRKNGHVQAANVRIVARKIRVAPHPRFAFPGSGIVRYCKRCVKDLLLLM